MRKELILCDVCGKETHLDAMCVAVDRKMDVAGSMSNEYEHVADVIEIRKNFLA